MLQALRTKVNLVLLAVLVLALALLVGLLVSGPSATASALSVFGVTSTGDEEQARIDAVTTAARNELNAIYTMNWKDTQSWAEASQAGATGTLLEALQASAENEKAKMFESKTTGSLEIISFGINKIASDAKTKQMTAVTFAYVGTRESRTAFKDVKATAICPAATLCTSYGLEVDLIQTPGGWKVSKVVRDR